MPRGKKKSGKSTGGQSDTLIRRTDELRAKMVEVIRGYGLPVGFVRESGDGHYALMVDEEGAVTPLGYAEQEEFLSKTLEDLDPLNLAFLLWEGSRGVTLSDLREEHGWGGEEPQEDV